MASVFGHALLAGAAGTSLAKELRKPRVFILGILCAVIPDADVIAFNFGVPYHSIWGHRGFTHSMVFGLLFGTLIMLLFHRKASDLHKFWLGVYYSFCTISHGILDGMTTGGMGIAYFWPFSDERYFLPFRKILVSPLGASRFFSEWGFEVLKSEIIWIGIPALLWIIGHGFLRKRGN